MTDQKKSETLIGADIGSGKTYLPGKNMFSFGRRFPEGPEQDEKELSILRFLIQDAKAAGHLIFTGSVRQMPGGAKQKKHAPAPD